MVVLVVVLLVLGPKRLPGAGRALGGGIREFRDAITGRASETGAEASTTPAERSPAPPA